MAVFVLYLAATQERKVVNEFAAAVRQYAPGTRRDMLTYAEELRQEGKLEGIIEGRKEGEIKAKFETIEGPLGVGAEWSLITKATGVTPERVLYRKEEARRLVNLDDSGDAQDNAG